MPKEKALEQDMIDLILRHGAGPEFSAAWKALREYVNHRTRYQMPLLFWEANLIQAYLICEKRNDHFEELTEQYLADEDSTPGDFVGDAGLNLKKK